MTVYAPIVTPVAVAQPIAERVTLRPDPISRTPVETIPMPQAIQALIGSSNNPPAAAGGRRGVGGRRGPPGRGGPRGRGGGGGGLGGPGRSCRGPERFGPGNQKT